ncbi:MAG: hypothetical protein ACE5JM_00725, partial [Armatimonadota bacterium]
RRSGAGRSRTCRTPAPAGRPGRPRECVLVDYTEQRQDGFGWPRARFIRDQRYKLYDYYVLRQKNTGEVWADKKWAPLRPQ